MIFNIYLFVTLSVLILHFLLPREKYIKYASLVMGFVYAFRNAGIIGIDTRRSYASEFYNVPYQQLGDAAKNFGWSALVRLVYKYGGANYHLLIIIVSIFVSIALYHLIKKYSENPLMTFFWYFGMLYYIFMFNALKQSVAMALVMYAFDAIMENRKGRFYIIMAFAGLFHFPSLVFLPAYWLSKMKVGKNYFIMLAAMFAIVFLFRGQILNIMMVAYQSGEEINSEAQFFGNKVVIMIAILLFSMIVRPPQPDDKLYTTLFQMMGIAAVMQTFCYYNNVFERLTDYYYQFSILFMPLIFKTRYEIEEGVEYYSTSAMEQIATAVIVLFGLWRFNVWYFGIYWYYFIPYKFFWQI